MEGFDFGSLGGLGGGGGGGAGGGDAISSRAEANTIFNYGSRDGALPSWALAAGLAVVGLGVFIGLLVVLRKL